MKEKTQELKKTKRISKGFVKKIRQNQNESIKAHFLCLRINTLHELFNLCSVLIISYTRASFTRRYTGFAATHTGGGLELPSDVLFGPCGSMYIADFGLNIPSEVDEWAPATGVIWKVTRKP